MNLSRIATSIGLAATLLSATASAQTSQIEEVKITGYRDNSTDIGRNTLEQKELARSVQVISNDFIESVQPYALEDILTLAPNVAFLGDQDGRENVFVMRGFQGTPVLRDGFRVETFGGVIDPELANIERIEVLKGPDSILYGESNPGGLINLVAKRPLSEDHAKVSMSFGSYGSYEPSMDIGGGNDSTRYRLVGLYSNDEGWRDFDNNNERIFIAPTVSFQLSDATKLTLVSELTKDDFQADFGTAIGLDGELLTNPEQPNNHPQDTIERHQETLGFDIEHQLSGDWVVGARLRSIDSGYEYSSIFLPLGLDQDSQIYFRVPAQQEQSNKELASQFNLGGEFFLGTMRNRVYMGLDYRESTTENQTRFNPSEPAFLDWLNPDYSQLPPPEQDIPIGSGFYQNEDITRRGIYLQNHLNITNDLLLSVGVRNDDVDRDPLDGSSTSSQANNETSFQVGAVYAFSDSVSAYASYSESFSPNFDLDKHNQVLEPETGQGHELGVKTEWLDGNLGLNIALFDITKQNVATFDPTILPTDLNPFGSIATGEQQNRGFEIDVSGYLNDYVQLFGSYGYTDSEVTKSNNGDQGLPVVGAPDNTASLWISYLPQGQQNGFDFSVGLQHVSERLAVGDVNFDGDTSDSVSLRSYTLLNARAGYTLDQWSFALNLNNITDEDYIDAAWGSLSRSVHPGSPAEAVFTVSYDFGKQ